MGGGTLSLVFRGAPVAPLIQNLLLRGRGGHRSGLLDCTGTMFGKVMMVAVFATLLSSGLVVAAVMMSPRVGLHLAPLLRFRFGPLLCAANHLMRGHHVTRRHLRPHRL